MGRSLVIAFGSPGLQVPIYYQRNTVNEANELLDGSKRREVRVDYTYFVGVKGDHHTFDIDRKIIAVVFMRKIVEAEASTSMSLNVKMVVLYILVPGGK